MVGGNLRLLADANDYRQKWANNKVPLNSIQETRSKPSNKPERKRPCKSVYV